MQTPARNKQETSIDQPARSGTRLRRWLLVGTVFLAILTAVMLLAPTILARTSLRNVAVQRALPDFPGQITIRSLQLGWFSPVRLEGLTVSGREGKQLADVSRIETEKTLWQLATGWRDVGRVRIIRPKLDVVLRSDGSNVEDVIAPWMKEEAKTSSQAVGVVLEITEGSADVVDQATNRCYKCDKLAISLQMPADARAPMAVKASGEIGDGQDVVGSFAVELSRQASGDSPGNLLGLLGRNGEIVRSGTVASVGYGGLRGAARRIRPARLWTTIR